MNVVIWGCGNHLKDCFQMMQLAESFDSMLLIDSNKDIQRNGWEGYPVYSPQMIGFFYYDLFLIGSEKYKTEIYNDLTILFHISPDRIIYVDDYIETSTRWNKGFDWINLIDSAQSISLLGDSWRNIYDIEYLFPAISFDNRIVCSCEAEAYECLIKLSDCTDMFVVSHNLIKQTTVEQLEKKSIDHYKNYITDVELIETLDIKRARLIAKLYSKIKGQGSVDAPACRKPFQSIEVHGIGEVRVCCPIYMSPIGDLKNQTFDEIWNGAIAKLVRLSIANRSFALCSQNKCPFMIQTVNRSAKLDGISKGLYGIETDEKPERLNLATDYTCNLACPSCRAEVRVADSEYLESVKKINAILIQDVLPHLKEIQIAGDGEVFFSKIYREILYSGEYQNTRLVLLSNGTLFTRENFEPLIGKWLSIDLILSMDGITKETLEKLRKGLKYERFIENLDYISEQKKAGLINRWSIDFVVQKENVSEMSELVKKMKKLGVDEVRMLALLRSSSQDYERVCIHDENGKIYKEYETFFDDPILEDSIVNWWSVVKP